LGYLRQKPDAELEDRLRRTIQQYGGELELQRLWTLLDRHNRRVSRTGATARVYAVRSKIRLYDSLREACEVLVARRGTTREQVLLDEIEESVCGKGGVPPS
jgi:hypothetical protein